MDRKYSNGSVSSASNFPLQNSSSSSLNPLIQLERLVHRLTPLLALQIQNLSEFDRNRHYQRLLEYQKEIARLCNVLNENSEELKKEFEWENRSEWIESKLFLLKKTLLDLEPSNFKENTIVEHSPPSTSESSSSPESNSKGLLSSKVAIMEDIFPVKSLKSPIMFSKEGSDSKKQSGIKFSETTQQDHDSLTSELISTIQLIKRNNMNLREIVKSDDMVINEASGLLATNTDTLQREGKNLKKYSKKVWMTIWKIILITLFVVFVFMFAYIFIRLT